MTRVRWDRKVGVWCSESTAPGFRSLLPTDHFKSSERQGELTAGMTAIPTHSFQMRLGFSSICRRKSLQTPGQAGLGPYSAFDGHCSLSIRVPYRAVISALTPKNHIKNSTTKGYARLTFWCLWSVCSWERGDQPSSHHCSVHTNCRCPNPSSNAWEPGTWCLAQAERANWPFLHLSVLFRPSAG